MNPHVVPIVAIVIGALVLLFGRRLFWLFVAAVGFWIGFEFAPSLMQHPPDWLTLAVAVVLGIIGAILAIVLQKVAIAVAGFLVGGEIAIELLTAFVTNYSQNHGIAFIIGGIIGAILLLVLFDWILILFSSIAGAELIVANIHVPPKGGAIIFIALVIVGIIIQATMFSRRRKVI